ncbi:MAG: rhodanese-like domain-containing protein [Kiloniellales bacterium]
MLKKGVRELLAEAMAEVETLSVDEAQRLHGQDGVVFVDVRDALERNRGGFVPASIQAERGMLEFRIDPESPMHEPALASAERVVFYCGSGVRSALSAKTAQDMGVANVCHLAGGFAAWVNAGGPVDRD